MTKRLKTTKPGELIEIEVYYSKGGTTLACMMGYSEGPEKRGYSLAVRRITVRDGFSQFCLGDGVKAFLLEVKRQSPKAAAQAEILGAAKEQEVLNAYLSKKGLQLAVDPETLRRHQDLEKSDGIFRNLSPIEAAQEAPRGDKTGIKES
jgi:hypothetical protein